MQRKFRLTRSEDFKRVRRSGKSYAHPLVVLIVQAREKRSTSVPNAPGAGSEDQSHVKVGVTAGRTVGSAVYRNRAKRLLREAMRPLLPKLASDLDLILIARPGLVSATLEETRRAVLTLLQRAKILIPLNES